MPCLPRVAVASVDVVQRALDQFAGLVRQAGIEHLARRFLQVRAALDRRHRKLHPQRPALRQFVQAHAGIEFDPAPEPRLEQRNGLGLFEAQVCGTKFGVASASRQVGDRQRDRLAGC